MKTKEQIGTELKQKIFENVDVIDMSKWALDVYLTGVAENNLELDEILSKLMMMDQGTEFELSRKELTKIADLLIVSDSPVYTRQQFGYELQEKLEQKEDVALIGRWAFAIYRMHGFNIDSDFKQFLKDLSLMEHDPQFEKSYEELEQIANRLIAGENVKWDA
jgi:hypothetical protein